MDIGFIKNYIMKLINKVLDVRILIRINEVINNRFVGFLIE